MPTISADTLDHLVDTSRDYFSNPSDTQVHQQRIKDELIQRATTRLRRRRLEEDLLDVISSLTSLRTQLESFKLEAEATIDAVSKIEQEDSLVDSNVDRRVSENQKHNQELDVLERRLQAHKLQLDQFKPIDQPIPAHLTPPVPTPSVSRLTSLSSLFSRAPSVTSASSVTSESSVTSISDNEDLTSTQECPVSPEEEQQRRHRRRRRVRRVRQQHQERVRLDQEDTVATELEWKPKYWPIEKNEIQDIPHYEPTMTADNFRSNRPYRQHRSDSISSLSDISISSSSSFSSPRGLDDIDDLCLLYKPSRPHHPLSPASSFNLSQHQASYIYPEDDMCSLGDSKPYHQLIFDSQQEYPTHKKILDEIEDIVDNDAHYDTDLMDDILNILNNPEFSGRSFAEIQDTVVAMRQSSVQLYPSAFSPSSWLEHGKKQSISIANNAVGSSWKWCKFLSILSASVMVSLANGPQDISRA
ncbi:hypothetical protein CLU79DRAFT_314363 [Phycomyces nitens]|nr:hypothetical protein CLU79DRAFT_314363 [Phycomyces nitens]